MLKRTLIAGALLCACSPAMAGGFWDDVFGAAPSPAHHFVGVTKKVRPARGHHARVSWARGAAVNASEDEDAPTGFSPLLSVARRFLGVGNIFGHRGPWCRDFVNTVAAQAGYRLNDHSRRAIDALRLGHRVASPRPGDLVVMKHHVTIYAGQRGGRVLGLGGNQGHGRVKVSAYPLGRVLAFVRL